MVVSKNSQNCFVVKLATILTAMSLGSQHLVFLFVYISSDGIELN